MEGSLSATIASLFDGTSFRAARPVAVRQRRKLWEIPARYHCVVIGTCLPMGELRKLARRVQLQDWRTASDYALHRSAVAHAQERNELSRAMHKELERRFAAAVGRFAAAPDDARLRELWREAVAGGDLAGAVWALMTHAAGSDESLEQASQELHMLSHQVGASSRADLRRLAALERENGELRERLAAHEASHARQLAMRDGRIETLERSVAAYSGMEWRLEQAQRQLAQRPPAGGAGAAAGPGADASPRACRDDGRAGEAEARCRHLEQALAQAEAELTAAERSLEELLARPAAQEAASVPSARGPLLFGRCVLYIGGRSGMLEHYRRAVERFGGRLVHHDGGLEDAPRRLQPLLATADAAVCAAGTVSHGAYYVVKRFCKQSRKPCVMLRKGSVSAFVQALQALAAGQPDLDGAGTLLVPPP